jgi:subtilisin-like proprotein convertase family protein
MRIHRRLVLRAVAVALLAGLGSFSPTAAPAQDFYYYSDGVQVPLLLGGQDNLGWPVFQTPSSLDKSGAPVAGSVFSLTNQFMVQLAAGADLTTLSQLPGVALSQQLDLAPGTFLFDTASPLDALNFANLAIESGIALVAEPQFAVQQHKRDLPNDPLFANQWHLRNTGQSGGTVGADINVVPWWNFAGGTRQGSGVNIAIVDDGLQYTHPDLNANYKAAISRDINFNDPDPAPNLASDFHGTAVAGVAAGRGNNGVGVSGVAPLAGISGIRLISAATTDAQEATGLTYQNNNQGGLGTNAIYSNSWGPSDDGATLAGPGPLTSAAFANAVATGRGGRGSIFTWAGGNGNGNLDNSNYDGYANSRYVIAVGASRNNANGSQSGYSEPGANLLVNAPSNGGNLAVTTTDLIGANGYDGASDYTNTFGGTSSATPVVSGAVALMLEANPNLGWRDVKHVLVHSSQKNDPANAGWTNNAAGLHINHAYGFGRVDANAAATLATTWQNVGPEVSDFAQSANLGLPIPDGITQTYTNPVYGPAVSSSLIIDDPIKVETVEVRVNVTHTYRGDLRFLLTAPSGTQSILGALRPDSGDNYSNWVFSTVRNWDESAVGTWTLAISDGYLTDIGTFNNWRITVYGTMIPEPASIASLGVALLCGVFLRRRAPR